MSITDELRQLHELHQRGALTDEEFRRAKARVLDSAPGASGREQELRDEIERLRVQARLDRLDQEWNAEKLRFLVQIGNQERKPLSRRMITVVGCGALGMAVLFLVLSLSLRLLVLVAPAIMALFFGGLVAFSWYQRVVEYEQLHQSYRQRRAALLADMPDATGSTEPPEPIALDPRLAASHHAEQAALAIPRHSGRKAFGGSFEDSALRNEVSHDPIGHLPLEPSRWTW